MSKKITIHPRETDGGCDIAIAVGNGITMGLVFEVGQPNVHYWLSSRYVVNHSAYGILDENTIRTMHEALTKVVEALDSGKR